MNIRVDFDLDKRHFLEKGIEGHFLEMEFEDLKFSCVRVGQEHSYKYLGINEDSDIHQIIIKETIRTRCFRRVQTFLRFVLNARNKALGINSLTFPVVIYSFNVLNWNISD